LSASGINGNGAGIDGKSQATKKVLGNRSESGKKINKKREPDFTRYYCDLHHSRDQQNAVDSL
jgi:hypothetical protein